MSTTLNVAAALVLCLPLLALAALEHHHRRKTQQPDSLAWIDERIRTRPDQRAAWRQLKKLMQEES